MERLDVWGAIRGEEFVVSVFESTDAAPRAGQRVSVAAALDRIDQIDAAFPDAHDRDLAASLGRSRILTIALGDATCVRRGDVMARHGLNARPIPVSPHRKLPAPWHLEYLRPWGRIVFAFRMIEPHDYDDCLVEVLFRQDS